MAPVDSIDRLTQISSEARNLFVGVSSSYLPVAGGGTACAGAFDGDGLLRWCTSLPSIDRPHASTSVKPK
jgi:hypothetical protein